MEGTSLGQQEVRIIRGHLEECLPSLLRVERALNEKSGDPGSSSGSVEKSFVYSLVFSFSLNQCCSTEI